MKNNNPGIIDSTNIDSKMSPACIDGRVNLKVRGLTGT